MFNLYKIRAFTVYTKQLRNNIVWSTERIASAGQKWQGVGVHIAMINKIQVLMHKGVNGTTYIIFLPWYGAAGLLIHRWMLTAYIAVVHYDLYFQT